MSRAQDLAKKWTCEGCGVSAGRIDGEPVPLPEVWSNSAEGLFCLICRRERAAEAALEAAPHDSPVDARAKLRTPDQADGQIARACRTSVSAVTRARRRLQLPDPPPPSKAARRAKQRATASR
jgi:hypothetical protein